MARLRKKQLGRHATAPKTFTAGSAGHVAIVTKVYPNGNVDLAQYNLGGNRSYSTVLNFRAPRYIYVRYPPPRFRKPVLKTAGSSPRQVAASCLPTRARLRVPDR